MSNHSYSQRWCNTWKSLLRTSIIISCIFVFAHFILLFFWDLLFEKVVYRIISGVIICHIASGAFIGCYFKNYKYLLNIHVMEKSSKRFWLGLLPIIVGELINILSLICFWVTK